MTVIPLRDRIGPFPREDAGRQSGYIVNFFLKDAITYASIRALDGDDGEGLAEVERGARDMAEGHDVAHVADAAVTGLLFQARSAAEKLRDDTLRPRVIRLLKEGRPDDEILKAARAVYEKADAYVPDDVLLTYIAGMRRASKKPATTAERRDPAEYPYFDLADAKPVEIANDFEGVLQAGAMSVMYGESNSGKTFLALDIALHVATGRPWRGLDVTRGAVIYLALEGGSGIRNRISAYVRHCGIEGQSHPFTVIPATLNLLDPEADCGPIIEAIKAHAERLGMPVSLVVIDTLARAMCGGNENSGEDMGALLRSGDRIRKETGAHVMWIHHSGKDAAAGAWACEDVAEQ